MDIINDITRVARESKRIIESQQIEIDRLNEENKRLRTALNSLHLCSKCRHEYEYLEPVNNPPVSKHRKEIWELEEKIMKSTGIEREHYERLLTEYRRKEVGNIGQFNL